MTIRVLLADDQALLRATFRLLLDSAPDIQVVAEAADGREAVDRARDGVDVIVMDIRMPEMDGIEATSQIMSDPDLTEVRILMLTTFETDELIMAALRAGATGFIGKGVQPADLLNAIRTVATGDALLSATATTALIRRAVSEPDHPAPTTSQVPGNLTTRELEIVTLVGTGLSNSEIADKLFISAATVKTHVNRAMMKVFARDRAQLVIFAYEHRLVHQ
ncbi:response regulator transcription factor [Nakamurella lactea]|uniref:response regulator transcription factor n=1 Tax=Nakamurella lactea TaxID=459515 RepID=UPI000428AB77|nr:response regulator transcription factor [Nakamurella lactea]